MGGGDLMTAPQEDGYCGDDDDLERFAGAEIEDPWADDSQTDWPNNDPINVEEVE
jgi:hypothetical protein